MFICKECFDKHYIGWIGLCMSYGPCELCGETNICDDHPSKYLKQKEEQEPFCDDEDRITF